MADSLSLQNILQLNAMQAVNSVGAPQKAADDGAQSFGNVLTKTADKATETAVKAPEKAESSTATGTKVDGNADNRLKENVGRDKNDRIRDPKENLKNGDVSEETKNVVKEAIDAVKEEIKEELDVSDEELMAAMETLGLTLVDLLKGENVGAIVSELTGSDISELVSDESLYLSVDNIMTVQREVTTDLLQEFNLTPEEFKEVLNSEAFAESITVETGAVDAKAETAAEVISPATEEKPDTAVREGTEEFRKILESSTEITSEKETAGTPAETVKTSETVREPDRQPDRQAEVVLEKVSFESEEVKSSSPGEREGGNERHFGAEGRTGENPGAIDPGLVRADGTADTFMDNLTEAVSETTSEFVSSYERVQDIMNQVRDQIRISVNQETTTMEMQLNPESLGKVGLHIESRAGNITAQFFAQDESVRAALESQIAELKQNLTEQGIKVESVEVTLASREFESNFLQDGGQRNGDTPDEEEAERAARLRRINLGAVGAEGIPEEEMTEGEALNVRMMRENGGTVDFTA